MTTRELIKHPTTATVEQLLLGAVAALLFSHGVEAKEELRSLQQWLASDEVKGLAVAVLTLFGVVRRGVMPTRLAQAAAPPVSQAEALIASGAAGLGRGVQMPSPPDFPPPVQPLPSPSMDKLFFDAFMRIQSEAEKIKKEQATASKIGGEQK